MASHSVTAAHAQSVLPQTWLSNLAGWQDALPLRNATADWSTWQYVVTLILGLVVYDQGKVLKAIPGPQCWNCVSLCYF